MKKAGAVDAVVVGSGAAGLPANTPIACGMVRDDDTSDFPCTLGIIPSGTTRTITSTEASLDTNTTQSW
mgnify:CR=1 FL=1